MEVPPASEIAAARAEALRDGADPVWVARFGDGLTGVVGTYDTGRPGPTVAFRVDLDALPVHESTESTHLPAREHFTSTRPGRMHACGHDGHAAIGLGLARVLPALLKNGRGKIKLIFQPAEEGCRGAKSMVAAGVLSDVDYYFATHLGISLTETGAVACGTDHILATTKLDATFHGVAAHAGVDPHRSDLLGRLCLSSTGLLNRDRLVLDACLRRGIAIATVIGGGYDALTPLVERHSLVFRAASEQARLHGL